MIQSLSWKAVVLVLGGGAMFTLIALFAPPDTQVLLLGANGLISTIIGLALDWRRKRPPHRPKTIRGEIPSLPPEES